MARKFDLGAFFDNEIIHIVITSNSKIYKTLAIPVNYSENIAEPSVLSFNPEEVGADIKALLQKERVKERSMTLALPSSEIIFRTFIIPWMPQNEVKSVVDFEAAKYIPFALDELVTSYSCISYLDNDIKKIRVIFIAIKKQTLDLYLNAFELAEINLSYIEPAPSSLIRLATSKNIVNQSSTTAIFLHSENFGRLVIMSEGIPHFVREFQLGQKFADMQEANPTDTVVRATNEVRVSIDYFNRQNPTLSIDSFVYMTDLDEDDLGIALQESLGISFSSFYAAELIGRDDPNAFPLMSAYGAAILEPSKLPIKFNLSPKQRKNVIESRIKAIDFKQFQTAFLTMGFCALIFFGVLFWTSSWIKDYQSRLNILVDELGLNADLDMDQLEKETNKIKTKLSSYEKIRHKSQIAYFLGEISRIMPVGVWLDQFYFIYKDKNIKLNDSKKKDVKGATYEIEISGYAYSPVMIEQYPLITNFLKKLKEHEKIVGHFPNIELLSVKAQKLQKYSTTKFIIRLK